MLPDMPAGSLCCQLTLCMPAVCHDCAPCLETPAGDDTWAEAGALPLQDVQRLNPNACLVQAGRFAEAWECATVNRMDLSLIAAHGWPRFLSSAAAFVAAVPKDQDLVDFLTSLQPHDTRSGLMLQLQDSEQVRLL